MATKLYVKSLPWSVRDAELADFFSQFGTVVEGSSKVILDKDTGRSRGFGFIEVAEDDEAAEAVIGKTNGIEMNGRPITVVLATPQERT